DRFADSITIFYKYYDSTRFRTIDSSISNFANRFPVPYTFDHLGNVGTAARSLLFNPIMQAGWDAGFHQFDIYKYTIENTKFYQTTRPYTELGYLLGGRSEQLIDLMHTQNRKSNLNFGLEYRFINSPGLFRLQNTTHNNFRFTLHYQSNNKRYENFFIFLSNKHASSENGGLQNKSDLDSLALNNPYELDTRLGIATAFRSNPFATTINTGNTYRENTILYRHQYDLGQRDSIVTDSVTYQIFYPRFRLQHTLQISGNEYEFLDVVPDSTLYKRYFNFDKTADTTRFKEKWSRVSNEFSLISFPDKNNQSQYVKLGAVLQNLQFRSLQSSVSTRNYNISILGEYRNRTRNNIWDIVANGTLYVNGFNAGDYKAYISLQRQLSKQIGSLQIGFENVNRTPSFIFDVATTFPIKQHASFKKENTAHFFATYHNPKKLFTLKGDYFLVNNYAYSDSFFSVKQEATLFNVLRISAEKQFKISKHINWYMQVHLQQATGMAPINMPFLLTQNRLAFEGNFFTNLFLSTGLEVRYASNYKPAGYSPFTGQFFYQDRFVLRNRPDVNVFFHFRIKSFKSFIRFENINTLDLSKGFSFTKYNFKGEQYANTGLWFRLGVWWNFVN
ncbi:MAG: putative porin, partial [Chitinophagaceae bacterium]